jgi:hypothetical protein
LTKVPAVSVKGAIGSSTSATSAAASLKGGQRDHQARPCQRLPGGGGVGGVERRLGVQQQQAFIGCVSIWPAFRPPWPGSAPTSCAPTLLAASPR